MRWKSWSRCLRRAAALLPDPLDSIFFVWAKYSLQSKLGFTSQPVCPGRSHARPRHKKSSPFVQSSTFGGPSVKIAFSNSEPLSVFGRWCSFLIFCAELILLKYLKL
jgi:hypothetical protein